MRRRMALTTEEWISKLAPDLQGLLDSRKVAKEVQASLAKNSIDSIPMLSAVAIDREGLAGVAKDLLGVDVSLGGDETIRFAQLFLAWQSASKRIKVQDETGMDLVGCFVLIDVGDCAGIPCSFILGKHSNFKINQYAKKVLEHVHGSRVTSHATMPERLAISVTKLKFS